jgi:SAM-dependent methyltransferase
LEIGPGSGQVTLRIAATGAPVTAVEPDAALAARLAERAASARLNVNIRLGAFEDVALARSSYDLAVAATAFHWLDQPSALKKVRRLLVRGGWWAMWWTVFADESRPDPFFDATTPMLARLGRGPSAGSPGRPPFALDVEARTHDLLTAGFQQVEAEVIRWTASLDTAQVCALYSTFSSIARLPQDDRERLLMDIAAVADGSFGGHVQRPFQTVIYTAIRP